VNRLVTVSILALCACGSNHDERTNRVDHADRGSAAPARPRIPTGSAVPSGLSRATLDRMGAGATAPAGSPLTLDDYEQRVLALASCKLVDGAIDGRCPALGALDATIRSHLASSTNLLEMNGQLGRKLIGHASPAVRIQAAHLLTGMLGTQKANQDLIVAAYDKETDPHVRRALIRSIGFAAAENPQVAGLLYRVLASSDAGLRESALLGLAAKPNRTLPGLGARLARLATTDPDPVVRRIACALGGTTGDPAMLPVLDKLTARADDPRLYEACMQGVVKMFHQPPLYETHDEAAYRLFLGRISVTPRTHDTPPWTVMNAFQLASDDARNPKLVAWKKLASWFDPAAVRKPLVAIVADHAADPRARTFAIDSLVGLGISRADLEALRRTCNNKNPDDQGVLKKLGLALTTVR